MIWIDRKQPLHTPVAPWRALQRWRKPQHLGRILATNSVPPCEHPLLDFLLTGKLPFRSAQHLQSRQELAAIQQQIVAVRQQIKRQFLLGPAAILLLGIGSLGVPLASLVGIPLIIYSTLPYFHLAYIQVFKQQQIGRRVTVAILITGVMASGYFLTHAILFSIGTLADVLVLQTYRKTNASLTTLLGDIPTEVWVRTGSSEIRVALTDLTIGMVVVVHAGEMIAVDGTVVAGAASIDQRALTGEAQPVEKEVGTSVLAGTLVLTGTVDVVVEQAGSETVLATIGKVLAHTTSYTTTLELKGLRLAEYSVIPTLLLGLATLPFLGVESALAVLLCSFGGSMRGLAPLSVLTFLKIASDQHILVKDGRALETLQDVDTVVFDKTGTLTEEQPHVARVHPFAGYTEDAVLGIAAAAEHKQTHPIARALRDAIDAADLPRPEEAAYEVGSGLTVQVAGEQVRVGSMRFMESTNIALPPEVATVQRACHAHGHTLVYVAVEDILVGAIELHATIRPEAAQVIAGLHERGMKVVLISGDQWHPTQHLAQQLGIDDYYAEVLPAEKSHLVAQLQAAGGTVCFVGDGINDAIALKQANVSVSLRGATTIATDTAEVVLMDGSLRQLGQLFALADELEQTMHTNLALSLIPSMLVLGGVYGLHIGLVMAAVIKGTATCISVGNALLPGLRHYAATHWRYSKGAQFMVKLSGSDYWKLASDSLPMTKP